MKSIWSEKGRPPRPSLETHTFTRELLLLEKPCGESLRFDDFAAAQAGGADADALALSVDLGVHRTQVEVPAPPGHVVGVADAVAGLRLTATDITLLCHD